MNDFKITVLDSQTVKDISNNASIPTQSAPANPISPMDSMVAQVYDAIYPIAMEYITNTKTTHVLIPCAEFSLKCVDANIQADRFSEIYKAMSSMGFEHREIKNRTYWYLA